MPTLNSIAAEFRSFAERRAGTYAPLYARLGAAIADDVVLLGVAAHAPTGQSRPDLLLALIHQLLLCDPDQSAARFYPSITANVDRGDPAPEVLGLARRHHQQLLGEIGRRLVQTNEVGRCTFLAPAITAAAAAVPDRPLALLEVGASAGLNLLPDRYGYRYHRGGATQAATEGEPTLDCLLRSGQRPPTTPLRITWRAGIDLNPLDVDDADDRRWLRALVWPDHPTRARRLDHALRVVAGGPDRPTVHQGDAAAALPAVVATAPTAAHLVVYHCAVTAHMPIPTQEAFAAAVLAASHDRDLSWVQAEPRADHDPRRLRLLRCRSGRVVTEQALGCYHPHGQWLTWSPTGP